MTPAYYGCIIIGVILVLYVNMWNQWMQKDHGSNTAVWGFIGLCLLMTAFAKFIALATL